MALNNPLLPLNDKTTVHCATQTFAVSFEPLFKSGGRLAAMNRRDRAHYAADGELQENIELIIKQRLGISQQQYFSSSIKKKKMCTAIEDMLVGCNEDQQNLTLKEKNREQISS